MNQKKNKLHARNSTCLKPVGRRFPSRGHSRESGYRRLTQLNCPSPDVSCATSLPSSAGRRAGSQDLPGSPATSQVSQTKIGQQPQHNTGSRRHRRHVTKPPDSFFPWKLMLRRSLGGSYHPMCRETPGWAGNSAANRLEICLRRPALAACATFPWQPGGRAG